MSESEPKKQVDQKKDPDKKTDQKNGEDDAYTRAQRILADFRTGMSLSIYRLRPSWCSGFLERLECFDDEPIDIDYIIHEWGGKRLKLRICNDRGKYISGADLNLSSYPPRFRRRIMNPDDDWLPSNGPVKVPQQNPQQNPQQTPQQSNQPADVIKLVRELKGILADGKVTVAPEPAPVINPLKQFLETAEALKKVQGLFGSAPTAPMAESEPDPTSELFGQITGLITAFRGNPTANPVPKPKRIVPDSVQQPVVDTLAALDPEKYTNILLTSLQKMPENKRETIIANFIRHTGIESLLDGNDDEQEDVNFDDLDDDDTEDKQDTGSRGSLSPNETDD